MQVLLKTITIRDLVENYMNKDEEGVFGYDGKLSIRPAYQREFVYKDKQQVAVINSIMSGMPLSVMYWVDKEDGTFEVLDGQQRTMSICEYYRGAFAKDFKFFHNLDEEEKSTFLDYKMMIYICKGSNQERLSWFETINISGERLTNQELRNATYTGTWLSNAKFHFSKTNCGAFVLGRDYIKGSPIRQDFLETVLDWISDGKIETYMATNQHKEDASELWEYYRKVINWVKATFPTVRREMKGINWGKLYNQYGTQFFDPEVLEEKVKALLVDEDVTKKAGIYTYLLTGEEKLLNIRAFPDSIKRATYEKQNGKCPSCENSFKIGEMEADHVIAWSNGGKTDLANCQMLCVKCNRHKSNK